MTQRWFEEFLDGNGEPQGQKGARIERLRDHVQSLVQENHQLRDEHEAWCHALDELCHRPDVWVGNEPFHVLTPDLDKPMALAPSQWTPIFPVIRRLAKELGPWVTEMRDELDRTKRRLADIRDAMDKEYPE